MASNAKFLIFDLDGTLTDPYEGISRCIIYALEKLEHKNIPTDLRRYIGPALRYVFEDILQTNETKLIERAIEIYRERFSTVGLFENIVYPNIPETLKQLKASSAKLYIATAKPEPYARQILEHFELSQYFEEISGATLDGKVLDKVDIIQRLIERTNLDPTQAVMIGDRYYDVEAGKAHGMKTIGLAYGFGSVEELQTAGADLIVDSVSEIFNAICNNF